MHWEKRLFFMAKYIKAKSTWQSLSTSKKAQSLQLRPGCYGPHYTLASQRQERNFWSGSQKTKMQLTQKE